jgi:NADH-quinone oxidoreductase subunit L
MEPASTLPTLLMIAWLIPLASFVLILFFGKQMGTGGKLAGYVATGAIAASFLLSLFALFGVWLPHYEESGEQQTGAGHEESERSEAFAGYASNAIAFREVSFHTSGALRTVANVQAGHSKTALEGVGYPAEGHDAEGHANNGPPKYYAGDWYALGIFGKLKLTIGYYIDALTVAMFCMVTLISSCVHLYATGYMHDELHEITDPEATLSDGSPLRRKGRYHRFFQYLSLFSFSMLGVVIAGNMAMVFVFWELVGICSYFLIGFYIERESASNAANKAFIVNRIGDFGMLIGMMALWASLGTFAFGDKQDSEGKPLRVAQAGPTQGALAEPGIFSLLRTPENDYRLQPSVGMIAEAVRDQVGPLVLEKLAADDGIEGEPFDGERAVAEAVAQLRDKQSTSRSTQWLLLIAGVGIFCGCVGKSAQFPLHVWLPDATEGPTPVSALVHSAMMVAAGVYLVGRFYPVFSPEALLVIAYVGCITLFMAATIAITATDIKRVLAYSTVSQLGYMMLALGLGGWLAGMFHLLTHAFFKGLLFLCSGSVVHAMHTNEMTEMGGLRKKMPITAYTMLIGCLAIIGAGIPLSGLGFSGFYSKDAIIEQAWSYGQFNPNHVILKFAPVAAAFITAFYMFRLWYMTFAGKPRDQSRYDHAHESPRSMTVPLVILALFAIGLGWSVPFSQWSVTSLLEQARPVGTQATTHGELLSGLTIPDEHLSHVPDIKFEAGLAAFFTAAGGLLLATIIYLWRLLDADELKQTFRPLHQFLRNKWWFDELYKTLLVKPLLSVSRWVARFDLGVIDAVVHGLAALCRSVARVVDRLLDRTVVDGSVNTFARGTWDLGLSLRKLQTGNLRHYVMLIVVCTVLLFMVVTYMRDLMLSG